MAFTIILTIRNLLIKLRKWTNYLTILNLMAFCDYFINLYFLQMLLCWKYYKSNAIVVETNIR